MTNYSPMTEFLKEIEKQLSPLGYPIYYRLPDSDVEEPFVLIGNHLDDNSRSAKNNNLIIDTSLQIDIYMPDVGRLELEEVIHQVRMLLGRRSVNSSITPDNTIGRKTFHITFQVNDLVL